MTTLPVATAFSICWR